MKILFRKRSIDSPKDWWSKNNHFFLLNLGFFLATGHNNGIAFGVVSIHRTWYHVEFKYPRYPQTWAVFLQDEHSPSCYTRASQKVHGTQIEAQAELYAEWREKGPYYGVEKMASMRTKEEDYEENELCDNITSLIHYRASH